MRVGRGGAGVCVWAGAAGLPVRAVGAGPHPPRQLRLQGAPLPPPLTVPTTANTTTATTHTRAPAAAAAAAAAAGVWRTPGGAGRDAGKLAAVRDEIGAPADTPLVIADASAPASLDAMAGRAKVVLTTVGPYQLYGTDVVAACVRAGTDYVDLCGEPAWMRAMIDAHDAGAKASGADEVARGFPLRRESGLEFERLRGATRFGGRGHEGFARRRVGFNLMRIFPYPRRAPSCARGLDRG